MSVMIFAKCVEATVKVAVCKTITRVIRSWIPTILAPVLSLLGGFAKRTAYIAVASSLSPPM